jgi:hypothetical protein
MASKRVASLKATWVFLGDIAVYLVATVLGFASHDELSLDAWSRLLATLVPFVLAWFLISPWIVGGMDPNERGPSLLWRPALAAIYAAPLGAWLRGLWIGAPIQVVFVAVMGAVTATLMVVWRAGMLSLIRRRG